MQFIDEAEIEVIGGNGGDGVVAWRREKYVPKGGPAGGDGGRGGSVILEARTGVNTLIEFRYKRKFEAVSGNSGEGSNSSGKAGPDMIIGVPIGTIVYEKDAVGGERVMADLAEDGMQIRVAKGGRGGLGNQHFATSTRQAPYFAEKGEPSETRSLRLELKLLADCGLIGFPNAGKSSLLASVSAAKPKIADYPFTTLQPQLGVVRVERDASFVMVDLPGLIEGASDGVGLGDRFLKHAERTRILIHLLDGALDVEEIRVNKAIIENELRSWSASLADKPIILAVTKADLPGAEETFETLRAEFPELRLISSATRQNVQELLFAAWRIVDAMPAPAVVDAEPRRIALTPKEPFAVERDEDVWVISGERVERLAAMTDFESDEAFGRFERILNKLGVEKRLEDLGIREGDTVRIAGREFTYS